MATVKSYTYNPSGTLTVTYDDGHNEIMSQQQAISAGVIQDPGNIVAGGKKNPATIKPGSYGSSTGTQIADPFGSGTTASSNFSVPINGQQVPISTLLQKANDPTIAGQIGTALRQYGVIGKGVKSQQSVLAAYTSVLVKAAAVGMNPNDWMAAYQKAGGGADTQVSGPTKDIRTTVYTPQDLEPLANQIYINELGRKVTQDDLIKLTDAMNKAEKVSPTVTSTVPKGTGTTTQSTVSGGVSEQGFIDKYAQQQPEYAREQNINFASWMDKAIKGGQPSIGSLTNG
jgi:hypothetical protein